MFSMAYQRQQVSWCGFAVGNASHDLSEIKMFIRNSDEQHSSRWKFSIMPVWKDLVLRSASECTLFLAIRSNEAWDEGTRKENRGKCGQQAKWIFWEVQAQTFFLEIGDVSSFVQRNWVKNTCFPSVATINHGPGHMWTSDCPLDPQRT